MSFCTNCGKELNESDKFCPSCGKPTENSNNTYSAPMGSDFSDKFNEYTSTEDKTYEFDFMDISDNKVFALLSYIGILVLVPLIAAPKSKFARFHANQGLVLLIGEAAYSVARGVLLGVLRVLREFTLFGGAVFGPVYWIVNIITGLFSLVFLVFAIIGIINAAQGKAKELPFISRFNIIK
ncbi:MAG: zinc ribbon domain-containing protein [Acutalibacteraceae bacterium]|nr:zinc ribbon domain-containing protein [Acutalibacteraceae bacterium]